MSFEELEEITESIYTMGTIREILGWDQQVMMPKEGIKARSKQNSTLWKIRHQKITSSRTEKILRNIDEKELSKEQRAVFREMKRKYERESSVSLELKKKISEKASENIESWREAKEKKNYDLLKEDLKEIVELKREYAEQIDSDREPYHVLVEDFEPYLEFEKIEEILQEFKSEIPDLVEKVRESEVQIKEDALDVSLSKEENRELAEKLARTIGFDFDRGRLDTSSHPFTNGNQFDTRITTRFDENSVNYNIGATIHETGHALYQQGLPQEHFGSPLGSSRELSIHESQSRLWENHVGRSLAFWKFFSPEMKEISQNFEKISPEEFFESMNAVKTQNLIRVEADELTYPLHIILRFELERKLVNGQISVEELPKLWNKNMEEYLGVKPENDAEGVLQDIHWASGSFGYFPTYVLGEVLAAQLYQKAEDELDNLEQKISDGEFQPLLEWLREKIHGKGQLLTTQEIIMEATGEPLNPEYLLDHLKSKYGRIYGF